MTDPVAALLSKTLSEDWGRLLSVLIRETGDFQLAEDSLQDASEAALRHWPRAVPDAPAGWLLKAARRKAIDRLRRRKTRTEKAPEIAWLASQDEASMEVPPPIPDDRLRLIFTACHPSIDQKTQVALTLRTLCGLTTDEIARAFVDKPATMAQRLARAKDKISRAGIAYKVPEAEDWDARLGAVLTVIYLIFNEGYAVTAGAKPIRRDLCEEAIYLGRMLDALTPAQPEVEGLCALMMLTHARRVARMDASGALIALSDQDRSLWKLDEISDGQRLLRRALLRGDIGLFQLQAAVAAVHSDSKDASSTNWCEIVALYDQMLALSSNPVIALNRAVALSERDGASAGLAALGPLSDTLDAYQPFHAAQAALLSRIGGDAGSSYDRAIAMSQSPAEQAFLASRRAEWSDKKKAEQSSAQVQQGG